LREFLTNSEEANKFNHKELKEVFDLCLSCKACASECPSNVDIATMKAEFLYQYQEANGYSFRNKLFANNAKYNKLGSYVPKITNFFTNSILAKKVLGVAIERTVPKLANQTLENWLKKHHPKTAKKAVYLFNDEFTNFYDAEIGKDAVVLLEKLGYQVKTIAHDESGRSHISKGFLKEAKEICNNNIAIFKDLITDETPLIGIEPSAILGFRDEYIRLADDKVSAEKIAKNSFTFEEFLAQELEKGNVDRSLFTSETKTLKIHGHCHQKALSGTHASFQVLNIPTNYSVTIMNTGCCGMAGSFGYEKEHYKVSMQVGEDTLFPKIRNCSSDTEIAAAGTSCRHQIFDGTKRIAKHPITLLKEALI
jgi:Fe-S oxidoreductase